MQETDNSTQLAVYAQQQVPSPQEQQQQQNLPYPQKYPNQSNIYPPPYTLQQQQQHQVGFVNPQIGFVPQQQTFFPQQQTFIPQQSAFIPSTSNQGLINVRDHHNYPSYSMSGLQSSRVVMTTSNFATAQPSAPH